MAHSLSDVLNYAGEPITIEEMLKLQCDIFIPAAVPDVIDEKVARELNCRYVVEAANGPTTVEGDKVTVCLVGSTDSAIVPTMLLAPCCTLMKLTSALPSSTVCLEAPTAPYQWLFNWH